MTDGILGDLSYAVAEKGDGYYRMHNRLGLAGTGEELARANGYANLYPGTIALIPGWMAQRPTPPPPAASDPGVVQLDSFAGATDDAKLTAALSYAAAQTRIPWIQFPARVVNLNQGGRVPFTGMKLCGPGLPGPKHQEVGGSNNVTGYVAFGATVTTGTGAWFHSTAQIFGISVRNMAFRSATRVSQFWSQTGGSLYSCEFHSLNFYGMKHVFGTNTAKALLTGCNMTGFWVVNAGQNDTSFHFGGSDNQLWFDGFMNIENNAAGGAWQIVLDAVSKTNVGRIYCTAANGYRGIRVSGNSYGLTFWGTTMEGHLDSIPCHGSTLRIEGGSVGIIGCHFGYAMTNPTLHGGGNSGVIHITGGNVLIDRPYYHKAASVAESVPFIYMSGGTVQARSGVGVNFTAGLPRIQRVGGALTADATYTVV